VADDNTGTTYIDVADAAQVLNVSRAAIRRQIASGRLPCLRFGPRLWRISRADLEEFAEQLRTGGDEA